MNKKQRAFSYPLFLVICILLCFGLVTLASASSYSALDDYGDSLYYFKRQIIFAVIGVIAMLVISKVDYKLYKKWAYIAYIITALMMIAVFIPSLGVTVKGARRWLNLGFTTMQPSEMMKIVLVIAASNCIASNYTKNSKNMLKTYGPIVLMLLLVVGIILFTKFRSKEV